MTGGVQDRLLSAVYASLRPLAQILLRSGISYKQFADVAKRAFIQESLAEKDAKGRSINTSRVAVRTGLSRKEVRRLLEVEGRFSDEPGTERNYSGPPAKVLHAWHMDRRFTNERGIPLDLEFDVGSPTFCDLVRAVAGDVPPGAVRAELKRAAAIEDLPDGKLRAVKRYFVPGDFDEKAIAVISGLLYPLTAGIAHNSNPNRKSEGFIQRLAYSERLDSSSRPMFRKWSRAEATKFIEAMDDWLAENEMPSAPGEENQSESIVGIGVFYFEGPSAEQVTGVSSRPRPRTPT